MKRLALLPVLFFLITGISAQDSTTIYEVFKDILNRTKYVDSLQEFDEHGNVIADYYIYEVNNKVITVHPVMGSAEFQNDSLIRSRLNESLSKYVNAHIPLEARILHVTFKNCVFTDFIHFSHHNYRNLSFENCSFENDVHISDCGIDALTFRNCTFNGKKVELKRNQIIEDVRFENNAFKNLNLLGLKNNQFEGELLLNNNKCSYETTCWAAGNQFSKRIAFTNTDLWSLRLEKNLFYSTEPDTFKINYRNQEHICTSNERLIFYNIFSAEDNATSVWLIENEFESETGTEEMIYSGVFNDFLFLENKIDWRVEFSSSTVEKSFWLESNTFNSNISFDSFIFSEMLNSIPWHQIEGYKLTINSYSGEYSSPKKHARIMSLPIIYKGAQNEMGSPNARHLIRSYKTIYDICKKNGDIESANGCYAEMKQVETRRWKYLFEQNKTFESFFRWQLNSFLSYFTDYGTNPAKAVIKSGWVILLFAIFYLFFPSDWDVSNRAEFLQKWKQLLGRKKQEASGKWGNRFYLTTLAFIAYTGFIHILNALTLSLNAFTTLGFGDIPTHGAARYVTIVQGFIGWFLLTIFSVSLINQVLG